MPISTYRTQVNIPEGFPGQHQDGQPGRESVMNPQPVYDNPGYRAAGKLEGLKALITGGDSGIGRAVAIAFAKEGADLAILHHGEGQDAQVTKTACDALGVKCGLHSCDLKDPVATKATVDAAVAALGGLDILVNNAAVQYVQNSIQDISVQQIRETFETNIFSVFHVISAAMAHLKAGASIINTASVTAYKGQPVLLDYSSTKGAMVALTRSLSQSLAGQGIRVNAVAPGPVWTPLIPSSFSPEDVAKFGKDVPLGRAAQPFELAPAYVFLAAEDSAFMTGQVLHVNGGTVTGS